jgi:3-hydroxyisobutyrate dehydrogenase-like beta-hydroxyacid dehydrogenase
LKIFNDKKTFKFPLNIFHAGKDMNGQRLHAILQIKTAVGSIALTFGICWGVAIGIPSAIIITAISTFLLPKALRKANMLSDAPQKFSPLVQMK